MSEQDVPVQGAYPTDNKDLHSTLAGGGIAAGLLITVNWSAIPNGLGEVAKIGVVLFLFVFGYLAYRKKG